MLAVTVCPLLFLNELAVLCIMVCPQMPYNFACVGFVNFGGATQDLHTTHVTVLLVGLSSVKFAKLLTLIFLLTHN